MFVLLVVAALLPSPALGLDNGLGRLPGLGWNSDYCTNCSGPLDPSANGYGDEVFIKHIADYMHTVKHNTTAGQKTLQELGFRYVNMDASWDLPNRSSDGSLVPDPKLWPSGLQHTVDYVHSLGMGFGLYGDRGTMDCARNPGQYGHEQHDAQWLADHEIDWFKSDACYAKDRNEKNKTQGQIDAIALYRKMGDFMNASGRPLWYALCGWMPFYAPVGKGLANSARIGPDTGGGWTAVLTNLNNALPVSLDAGPTEHGGYWNDGSLQLTPGWSCRSPGDSPYAPRPSDDCMTNVRFESMFSIWSVMAFNLLLVGDFAKLNPFVLETWTREAVIAVDQDPLGVPAVRVGGDDTDDTDDTDSAGDGIILAGPRGGGNDGFALESASASRMTVAECGGEPQEQKWILNYSSSSAAAEPSTGASSGSSMGGGAVFIGNNATNTCLDLATCKTWITYGACNATQTCGGTTEANKRWTLTAAGQLQTAMPTSSKCATLQSDKTVILAPCAAGPSVPTAQKWSFDASTGQLTNGPGGLCVTANPADVPGHSKIKQVATILGRPLAGGSFALLFLNNRQSTASVTCDAACLDRLKIPAGQTFAVTDIISGAAHAERPELRRTAGGNDDDVNSIPATVDGWGASRFLRLDPKKE